MTDATPGDPAAPARQVFVAYAYGAYPTKDYRRVFDDLSKDYAVSFVFADEQITNMSILQKIISYIRAADFSIFDITEWNPNVTLELGIGMIAKEDGWYIAFNPDKTDLKQVPSDLQGIDRIQYGSYAELKEKLQVLIEQRYPKRPTGPEAFLETLRESAITSVRGTRGLVIKDLAELAGASVGVMQVAVRPLVASGEIETRGKTRGMRYYLAGEAPPVRS